MSRIVEAPRPVETVLPSRRWPSRAGEWLWLAAAVLTPLVLSPWTANAFELPKASLVRALALGLALAAVFIALERPHRRRSLLLPVAAAFPWALVLILATALSVDGRASLWGSYDRQQGLVTLLPYLVLFAATAGLLETSAQWERLVRALVWGSAPIAAYGLLQAAGVDPLHWQSDSASPVLSTLGRSNLLGSYLVLVVPLTISLALPPGRRLRYALLLAVQLLCLLLTRARAAYLGLTVAALVAATLWLIETRLPRRRAFLAGAAGLAPALSLGLAALVTQLAPLSDRVTARGGSAAARVVIWAAALPLIADRPLLGYGPETFAPRFARVFPPQLLYYQGRGVYVDRAHNLGLDLALSAGMLGLLCFGALLAWATWRLWQTPSPGLTCSARVARLAITAALFGHLADLQFSFDLTGGSTVLFLLLALAASFPVAATRSEVARSAAPAPPPSFPHRTWERRTGMSEEILYLPPLLAVLGLLVILSLRPLRADTSLWLALRQGATPAGLRLAEASVALMPREPTYRFALARLLTDAGRFTEAEAQARAGVALSPAKPRAWVSLAEMYLAWSVVDPVRLTSAEAAYRAAIALAPNLAPYHTALGLTLAGQGRLQEALAEWERAVDLDATDYVAFGYLAQAYADLGRTEESTRAADQARYWYDRTAAP